DFGGPDDLDVPLMNVNLSPDGTELQLLPLAALKPGSYRVWLAGDTSSGMPVLADLAGTPIGRTHLFHAGQDLGFTFAVSGVEGGGGSDDVAATAHQLGQLGAGLVRVTGAIGDDPAYDPMLPADPFDPTDPARFLVNPAADVDLYHFRISGAGR